MTYKRRNTIILGSQTIIVCLAGLLLLFRYFPDRFRQVRQEIERCDTIARSLPQKEAHLADLNERIDQNRLLFAAWNKVVETNVTTADVLEYLNSIQSRFGSLKFNLAYVRELEGGTCGCKLFTLNGEGDWESIFALLWTLENGPRIFIIDKLELRSVETMEEDSEPPYYTRFRMIIPFSLQIKALYASDIDQRDIPPVNSSDFLLQLPDGHNIFYPAIVRNLPPNGAGLLEAERADLKAILPGKAIIADHLGTIHSLVEGDPVYLGCLLKINQSANFVEFLLNKGGIVENFRLKLTLEPSNERRPG